MSEKKIYLKDIESDNPDLEVLNLNVGTNRMFEEDQVYLRRPRAILGKYAKLLDLAISSKDPKSELQHFHEWRLISRFAEDSKLMALVREAVTNELEFLDGVFAESERIFSLENATKLSGHEAEVFLFAAYKLQEAKNSMDESLESLMCVTIVPGAASDAMHAIAKSIANGKPIASVSRIIRNSIKKRNRDD